MRKGWLENHTQRGFGVFAYIIMSVALLAALVSAISLGGRNNTTAQQNDILVAKIYGQASKIKSDILLCMTESTKASRSGATAGGPSQYYRFPTCDYNPDSVTDNNGSISDASDSRYCDRTGPRVYANAKNLTCLEHNDPSVWDASDGSFFPDQIPGFIAWKYAIEGATTPNVGGRSPRGVYLLIARAGLATDRNTDWIFRRVAQRFGDSEALPVRMTSITGSSALQPGNFDSGTCVEGVCTANALKVLLAR